MLSKLKKATTNSTKSSATVSVNPQEQAKFAVKFLCRKRYRACKGMKTAQKIQHIVACMLNKETNTV